MATSSDGRAVGQTFPTIENSYMTQKEPPIQEEQIQTTEDDQEEDTFENDSSMVDGKRACLISVGLILATLLNGLSYCWYVQKIHCVMQDYYLRERVFAGSHVEIQLTFVGTLLQVIAVAFIFIGNIIYSYIGFRMLLIIGVTMSTLGMVLAGMANSIWQLYLTVSVCTGIGIAFLTVLPNRIIPQWYSKYRSTAFGVQATVYPCAGLILPFLMTYINNTLGPSWVYRILGLIFFVITISGSMLIKERIPTERKLTKIRDVLDPSLLKNLNLMIWIIVGPIQFYAMNIVFIFLPSYATRIGLSDIQGAAVVSVLSGVGLFGRVINGMLADKFGNLNTFIIAMTIATVSVLIEWVFAFNFAQLMAFAVVHGLVFGCYFSIAASVTLDIVGMKKYPAALGLRMLPFFVSVFGPVIASYLESLNDHGPPLLYCKLISGAGYAACAVLSLFLKFRMEKRVFAKI